MTTGREQAASSPTPDAPPQAGQPVPTQDRDVALAILDQLDGRLCWVEGLGWLAYGTNGGCWAEVGEAAAFEHVMAAMNAWAMSVWPLADKDSAARLSALKNTAKGRAVLAQVKGLTLRQAAELDAQPDLLAVGNGVVFLPTGELFDHDPGLLLTRGTPTPYRPGATHPDWDTALASLPPDACGWLRCRIGQGITGYPPDDDVVPFLHNSGSGAKTTILDALRRALGDHMRKLPEVVLIGSPDRHPTEKTELRGARLAYVEELPEGNRLNTRALKELAGTGEMDGRRVFHDTITWKASHSLLVTTNHRPRVPDTDHGTWRRLALIPFPYRYVNDPAPGTNERPRDPGLRQRLRVGSDGRAEAVLAWAIEAACQWYAAGQQLPPMPPTVRQATDEWRGGEDVIAEFVADRLVFDPDRSVIAQELFAEFSSYLAQTGRPPWAMSLFRDRFEQHDHVAGRVTKRRTRDLSGVARRYGGPGAQTTPDAQPRVYTGITYANPSAPGFLQ